MVGEACRHKGCGGTQGPVGKTEVVVSQTQDELKLMPVLALGESMRFAGTAGIEVADRPVVPLDIVP